MKKKMDDLISRKLALEELGDRPEVWVEDDEYSLGMAAQWDSDRAAIAQVPSAQPSLYGYDVKSLETIAMVLRKENMPPERVMEILTDSGRIIAMTKDEFEESLRKAVEQCMTQSTDRMQ